ncbi:MAG: hypothetical protein RR843_10885, partial [Clostridia bacterium]
MAKDRRPQMDYYEYKRRHEALNPSDTPEAQPFARDESPEGEEVKKKGRLGGAKRAPRESVAEAPAPRQQETQTPPAAAKARPADVAQALREEPEEPEDLDDLEELDEPQIDTPFSDAFHKMKSLGGKLAGKLKRRPRDEDEDEDETQAQPAVTVGLVEDATSEGKAQAAKPAKSAAPKKAPAAKQDDEDEAPKRKLRLPFLSRDKADEAEEGEASTKPARKRFSLFSAPMGASEDEDDEDDDIAPSGGGIKLFGRRRARDE